MDERSKTREPVSVSYPAVCGRYWTKRPITRTFDSPTGSAEREIATGTMVVVLGSCDARPGWLNVCVGNMFTNIDPSDITSEPLSTWLTRVAT